MHRLIVVRTYYSLLVAINLNVTLWKEDTVDLLITNCSNNSEVIVDRLKRQKCFNEVYFFDTSRMKKYSENKIVRRVNLLKKYLTYYCAPQKVLCKTIPRIKYDSLAVFQVNIDLELCTYNYLLKSNPSLKLQLYEEAYSSYVKGSGSLKIDTEDYISWIGKITGKKNMRASVEEGYYYCPDMLQFEPYYKVFKIPSLTTNRKLLLPILNSLWDYHLTRETDSELSVVFCEDGAYIYGVDIGDYEIVKKCISVLSPTVALKLHPRSDRNRFKEITNCSFLRNDIPIEVILLNWDKDFIIATLYSSAAVSPLLCFENKGKGLFLYNLLEKKNEEALKYEKRIKKILPILGERCVIAKDWNEVKKEVKNDKYMLCV